MKNNTLKSSITLPAEEIPLVKQLKKILNLKSNTAVIRMALRELKNKVDRRALREQFRTASNIVRDVNKKDLEELDHLSDEGIS